MQIALYKANTIVRHPAPMNRRLSAMPPKPHPLQNQQGFSLIEVLIAMGIMTIVAIGILPMFTQSVANNFQGRETSQAVNRARSELEALVQADFNSEQLTLLPGETVEGCDGTPEPGREVLNFWHPDDVNDKPRKDRNPRWVTENEFRGDYPDRTPPYIRRTRIRQYDLVSLQASEDVCDWVPLAADADPSQIHIKQIQVMVTTGDGETSSIFGAPRRLTLTTFKAF